MKQITRLQHGQRKAHVSFCMQKKPVMSGITSRSINDTNKYDVGYDQTESRAALQIELYGGSFLAHLTQNSIKRNGGKIIGSRKLKVNLNLIRGKKIGTIINSKKNKIGSLDQVRYEQKEKRYRFTFDNGYVLTVLQDALYYHTKLRYENETIYFEYSSDEVFSGIVAYSLYESVGLPLEITVDEVRQYGTPVDEDGFFIMEKLQKDRNKDTFKDKEAFQNKEVME